MLVEHKWSRAGNLINLGEGGDALMARYFQTVAGLQNIERDCLRDGLFKQCREAQRQLREILGIGLTSTKVYDAWFNYLKLYDETVAAYSDRNDPTNKAQKMRY